MRDRSTSFDVSGLASMPPQQLRHSRSRRAARARTRHETTGPRARPDRFPPPSRASAVRRPRRGTFPLPLPGEASDEDRSAPRPDHVVRGGQAGRRRALQVLAARSGRRDEGRPAPGLPPVPGRSLGARVGRQAGRLGRGRSGREKAEAEAAGPGVGRQEKGRRRLVAGAGKREGPGPGL